MSSNNTNTGTSSPAAAPAEKNNFFGKDMAERYDEQYVKVSPLRDAIHLLLRIRFSHLANTNANILCVGAGTGSEVLYLAEAFPNWTFTLVEPSGPMLDVCRRRLTKEGYLGRCVLHEGYLDSLPGNAEPFHGATSLLVSQFIMDKKERQAYFQQIADRLVVGGTLVSSDLCQGHSTGSADGNNYESLLDTWLDMQRYTGVPEESLAHMRTAYGTKVAVSTPGELEEMIESGGFDTPVLFHQVLLIHAYYATKSAS